MKKSMRFEAGFICFLALAAAMCGAAAAVGTVSGQSLWQQGSGGYHSYRIPAIVTAADGSLLAFCEGRKNSLSDTGDIDVVMRRSTDGGATWGAQQVVWDDGANVCGNPVPIVDQASGRVVLAMTWNLGTDSESKIINKTGTDTRRVFVAHSDDHGVTWSTPVEITATTKLPEWGWYATGPGGGIQLQKGAHAGRLVVACDHSDAAGAYRSHVIYSDDAGATWQLGGTVPDVKLNECQVAELSDGRLILNMRNYDRTIKARRVAYSSDAGATWSAPSFDTTLIEPICQASLERVLWPSGGQAGIVAFLNPAHTDSRVNLTLRLSLDDAATWPLSQVLHAGPAAYSDMAMTSDGRIVSLYECGAAGAYEEIRFAAITLDESVMTTTPSIPAVLSSTFTNGLQIRFRADQGVNISGAANGDPVSAWQSVAGDTPLTVAASGGARPIWVKDAFARGGGSFSSAVRFNRDLADTVSYSAHWMGSTNNTRLNLGASSTWFVVMNLLDDNLQTSLFGFPESTARYGAFFLNTPSPANLLRTYNSGPYTAAQMTQRVPSLVDNRRSGSLLNTCLNGLSVGQNTSASGAALSTDQQFRIGAMLDAVAGRPKADIAEVIVYNRALNDAERVIIQNALAAQYGLTLGANDLYTGKEVAEGNFDLDVVGIGKFADSGATALPGAAEESGDSRGLMLTALNGSLANNGEFLFAGHNSGANAWTVDDTDGSTSVRRWQRVWKVQKISGDGIDARLTFKFASAGGVLFVAGAPYRLLYRADASSAFAALAANATEDGQSVYFDLADSTLLAGEYTLGTAEVTQPEPGLTDGLTLWFRADTVLGGEGATNGAPVAAWGNLGGLTAAADVAAEAEENRPSYRAEGFERAGGVYEPVVRFNWDEALNAPTAENLQRLTTGERVTDCGITEDSTWFLVFKTLVPQRDVGIFGSSHNTSRFGAFFIGTMDNRLRFQNNMYAYQVYEYTMPDQTVMVMDSRRFGPKTEAYLSTRGNGSPGGDFALADSNVFSAVSAQFRIGNQHFSSPSNNLVGDVAEIRVYNRALNDAERVIVQNHLAARYGKTLADNDIYKGKAAAAGDYDLDVVGIGCMTEAGLAQIPGAVTDSGDMAGLRLIALGGTLASHNEFVFAGHRTAANAWTADNTDGVTCAYRWSRDWYVNRAASTVALQPANDGIDVRLVFCRLSGGIAEPPYGGSYRLLFRRKLTDAFEALPVTAQEQGGRLAFDLTSDSLVNGYYTLGTGDGAPAPAGAALCAGVGRGLRAWFRAADAVTLDGGAVANWGNLGLSGPVLDVQPSNGAPQIVSAGFERAAGVFEPAVRFSSNERLVTAGLTDFDTVDSLTWFVVLRPSGDISVRANTGVFGLDNDADSRLGAFFTGTAPFYPLRGHAFCANNFAQFCQTTTLVQNVTQIADHRRMRLASSYAIEARLDGDLGERKTGTQSAPLEGRFKIGHVLKDSWGSAFKGDFAELRVYNRALTDAERVIIQNHLAARYGVALAANDVYAGKDVAAGDYDLDVVGIGCTTAAGTYDAPGAVARSEASAGLTLEALNGSLDEDGEYLLAGHKSSDNQWVFSGRVQTGVSRYWSREWYLDKTSAAGLDVRMSFDFEAAGVNAIPPEDEPEYLLLWRADAASAYVDTGLAPVFDGGGLTFDVPDAVLADGLYTVGVLLPARGTFMSVK